MSSDEIYEKGKGKRKLSPEERRAIIKRIDSPVSARGEIIGADELIGRMKIFQNKYKSILGPIEIPSPSKKTIRQREAALSMQSEIADMLMRVAQRRDKAMYRFRKGIPYGLAALGGATVGAILEHIRQDKANKNKEEASWHDPAKAKR